VREFAVFCLLAVLLIPAASAFGGAALRHSLGYAYWPAWEQWFMGNVLTQLIVTPVIFYLVLGFPWSVPATSVKRWVEGGLLTVGLIVTGYLAFSAETGRMVSRNLVSMRPCRFCSGPPFDLGCSVL
jgi:integral membrane sensor domain MASE1